MDSAQAQALARTVLERLPRRLVHVASVAHLAESLSSYLGLDGALLVSSAWLHDIGYARDAADTGFHALDGARFLQLQDVPRPVVNLVAHHSQAAVEAELRGLRTVLEAEFPYDVSLPHDLLCCDMTTGPSGERVTVDERLNEIRMRYGPTDLVTQFITRAEKDIVETVDRVEKRLADAAQSR